MFNRLCPSVRQLQRKPSFEDIWMILGAGKSRKEPERSHKYTRILGYLSTWMVLFVILIV